MGHFEVGLAVSHPSYPFGTPVARFKQARGWMGGVYFGLTSPALWLYLPCEAACNLIYLSRTRQGPWESPARFIRPL